MKMGICPKCGTDSPKLALFCPECGTSLASATNDNNANKTSPDDGQSTNNNTVVDSRPFCKYGKDCYQKNPQHLADFQHPQDHFSNINKNLKNDSVVDSRPICKYGKDCYQKNAQHLADYQHPQDHPVANLKKKHKDDRQSLDTLEQVKDFCKKNNYYRVPYSIRTEEASSPLSVLASKFGGPRPYTGGLTEWPTCRDCGKPMFFAFQINLDEIPKDKGADYGTGLFQMFQCGDCDTFETDCGANFLRVVPLQRKPTSPSPDSLVGQCGQVISSYHVSTAEVPSHLKHYLDQLKDYDAQLNCPDLCPANYAALPMEMCAVKRDAELAVVGFDELRPDWPMEEELEMLCEEDGHSVRVNCEYDYEDEGIPNSGVKIGGFPYWIQGVEYDNHICPRCQKPKRLFFMQLSEDSVLYNDPIGDCGTGQIMMCAEHKEEVSYGWACG
eukprot:GCRY01002267.1.p1 GENE.GCRY01002267.1~~GCRY01002267.1.p1  ORF type:complete len:442 (-),score=59.91 GCRY01002267.1:77-1402(-)